MPINNAAQEVLPHVPNPLLSREAPPLAPDQNPFPVEDLSPELDLDSVKAVLRNGLIIHRLGQKYRTISNDETTLIIDWKEKIPLPLICAALVKPTLLLGGEIAIEADISK